MFQPLLDAYIDSTQIEETAHKPPLNAALANWWGDEEIKEFKKNILTRMLVFFSKSYRKGLENYGKDIKT